MSPEQFIVAVISPEQQIRDQIASVFEADSRVGALWTLAEYPSSQQLGQIRDARGGCVVFLDFSDPMRAKSVASELDNNFPMAATVAVHLAKKPQDLIELMQLGIREVLTLPISLQEADRAFQRASRKLKREVEPEEQGAELFAFLPARPGSGATTIAAHSAAAAARLSGHKTLLIDFDLRLGMTSFLFKLHSEQSVLDALAFSEQLDDTLWEQLVSHRQSLDILGSAPIEFERPAPGAGSVAVLNFTSKRYQTICVDLPGEMREHELETLRRAKEIYLVCTPEVGTLHMAKRKADMLQLLDLQPRVSVIVNRGQGRGSMSIQDVESVLQLPVRFTVPAAEKEILEATQKAVAIQGKSPIAMQFEGIARRMVGSGEMVNRDRGQEKPRRLIEFFSVTPVRDKVGWKR